MTITEKIIDGQVKLDHAIHWPNGTAVTLTQLAHRSQQSEEAELAGLIEALEDVRAGRVYPAEQVLQKMATRYNFPDTGGV